MSSWRQSQCTLKVSIEQDILATNSLQTKGLISWLLECKFNHTVNKGTSLEVRLGNAWLTSSEGKMLNLNMQLCYSTFIVEVENGHYSAHLILIWALWLV